ncbi:TrkH family potassium uptake protein [Luteolibacter marinus]|uniref:TrkH family potassium uptake protein n=1 Tax=Luteolibacter marinus TaxID=2776705 RepID=UPI001867D514|nr:potassium transporter TrkG [Luteolibacter marinus]
MAFVAGAAAAGLLVWEIGWPMSRSARDAALVASVVLAIGVVLLEGFRIIAIREERKHWKRGLALIGIPLLALGQIALAEWFRNRGDTELALRGGGLLLLALSQVTLVMAAIVRLVRLSAKEWFKRLPPGLLVVGSFVVVIVAGMLLLKTPRATTSGISWMDSLFTSTSAVCVTGLAVRDTAADFTFSGQLIILGLIQIGGLGVMTLAYFIALITGQGISLRDRVFLNDMLSQTNVHMVGRFIRRIVLITLLAEGLGAFLLHLSWAGNHDAVWNSVFHSISAFCNAGFSTFSNGLMDDSAREARGVQMVIMALIIFGGLGFVVAGQAPGLVYAPLRRTVRRWLGKRGPAVRIPVHVRLVLATTGLLLAGGAAGFLMFGDGFWEAVFNSVSARTAGFNISNMADLSAPAVILMCFLMVIGGSPGGTAGGIKTTTFALGVLELRRILLGRENVNLAGRRISRDVIDRCHVTLVLSLLWILVSTAAVSAAEPSMSLDDVLFECVSAFATVGLSRGITADLGAFSKVVIVLTMLIGRIGILTFALSLVGKPKPRHFKYPEARLPLN